jgi:hypothetical protein
VSQELNSTDRGATGELISAALATEVCLDLTAALPDTAEIYRQLGYPHEAIPVPRIAQRIEQIVSEAQPCLKPQGTYSLYAVTGRTPRTLQLGEATISGNVGEFLAPARRVAVFVVTVGETISRLAEDAVESGDVFAAWVVDALGSCAAEGAADALMERIRPHLHDQEALTLRYSPGYCGMDMAQQRMLFQMVRADSVGVRLLPSLLMRPLKSISGLVGLGPKEAVNSYRSPCDYCPQVDCHMRR